jgi:hypothetical protein
LSDKNIIESGEKTAPAAEEENKIERMAQIQQTMHIPVSAASSQKSELPPLRRRMMETRMLDIPVTDNPPPPVPDEPEEHKQKMSQIREALAMLPVQQSQHRPKHSRLGKTAPFRRFARHLPHLLSDTLPSFPQQVRKPRQKIRRSKQLSNRNPRRSGKSSPSEKYVLFSDVRLSVHWC